MAQSSRHITHTHVLLSPPLLSQSVQVLTNNPRKLEELASLGVKVTGRLPCRVLSPFAASINYLRTKRDRMAHQLPAAAASDQNGLPPDAGPAANQPTGAAEDDEGLDGEDALDGSWCYLGPH